MAIDKNTHEGIKKKSPVKKPKRHWLHVLSYHLMKLPVRLFMFFHCGFRSSPFPHLRAPYILVANHATDYDMLAVGCRAPTQLYFVSGEQVMRMKWVGKVLSLFFHRLFGTKAAMPPQPSLKYCAGYVPDAQSAFFRRAIRHIPE